MIETRPGAGGRMIEPDSGAGGCLIRSGAPSRGGPTEAEVWAALRGVLDPELDRSIVDLGFVRGITVSARDVRVELRLPTYWCAPNFSWLMAADARDAVLALPGVERADVVLVDHHAADEVNAGVNGGRTFEKAFADEVTGGLEQLRRTFRRKAFFVRQERLLSSLGTRDLEGLRLGDLPPSPEAEAYLAIRAELGLDCSADTPAVTDPEGRVVQDLQTHLRCVRLMRVSLESNTALCRGLLDERYKGQEAIGGGG
jgi:metal-sulfur cluster biosynthetic enzyme